MISHVFSADDGIGVKGNYDNFFSISNSYYYSLNYNNKTLFALHAKAWTVLTFIPDQM